VDAVVVDLVTAAYNSGACVGRLLESARSRGGHRVRVRLFLHSGHEPTVAACERAARSPAVVYYAYGHNRGVSRSWNDGILDAYANGADAVVVANDDVAFSDGDLDTLVEKAERRRDSYIVTCAGPHAYYRRVLPSHGYACFAINPVALEQVGCFDENFFPAYCEDQDYAHRAALAGLGEENCPDTMVHHDGSGTIMRDPAVAIRNGHTQSMNILYYRRKWGGDPGAEQFGHPFGDPALDCHIAPGRRHAPYGVHDRPDRNLVRT
jgi:GT2 family glycosyltransferase